MYCRILWVWMKGNCLFIFFQMAKNMFGDYEVNIFNRISVYTTYLLVIINNILIPCKIILIVIFSFLKIIVIKPWRTHTITLKGMNNLASIFFFLSQII